MESVTKMFTRTREFLFADYAEPTADPQRGREVLGDNVRRVDSLCL